MRKSRGASRCFDRNMQLPERKPTFSPYKSHSYTSAHPSKSLQETCHCLSVGIGVEVLERLGGGGGGVGRKPIRPSWKLLPAGSRKTLQKSQANECAPNKDSQHDHNTHTHTHHHHETEVGCKLWRLIVTYSMSTPLHCKHFPLSLFKVHILRSQVAPSCLPSFLHTSHPGITFAHVYI